VRTLRIALLALALMLAGSAAATAQLVIKDSDDVNFKLGILGQFRRTPWKTRPRAPAVTTCSFGASGVDHHLRQFGV
jgi:hypothetical protein